MGLIDRVKEGAEQATGKARETVQEAQLRHDLAQAYGDLGRAAYALVEQGALSDERLASAAERVRGIESQIAGLGGQAA